MKKYNFKCELCNKYYIRNDAYNNHILKCRVHNYVNRNGCKDYNLNADKDYNLNGDKDKINMHKMTINNENIFKLLIDLHNKYDKLSADYNELKKYVAIKKNKINILDYLNTNCINSDLCSFDYFIENFVVNNELLELVFLHDYVEGILKIIIKNIETYKNNSLIKCFNQKENILYIVCDKSCDNSCDSSFNNRTFSWIVMDNNYFNKFIKIIEKKLLQLFLLWKEEFEKTCDSETFGEIYIKNMKKVIGGNFDKKNTHVNVMIKNRLYKHLKINIKEFVIFDYDFE